MALNLDTNTTLTIVGLIVSLILGYMGLKYTLKYRKKTEILFLKNTSISLFKTIVKNLDDIEINFKGKKINENLILFKGTFFNNGNIDIEKSIVHKPLEIELPLNYNWVSHKLIDASEGLEINSNLDNKRLIFEWDLLKEGEFFTFDSLVEYKSEKDEIDANDIGKKLIENIKINHRITDLKKVKKEESISRPLTMPGYISFSLALLGGVVGFSYLAFGQLFFPSYEIKTETNLGTGKQYVTLIAENENNVTVIDNEGKKIITLTKNELESKLGNTIKLNKVKLSYSTLIIYGILSVIYFIAWIAFIISDIRDRRLYRKIKSVAEKYDDFIPKRDYR